MSKLGIIAALPAEAHCLRTEKYKLNSPLEIQKDIFVCISGMGAKNASTSARKLIEINVNALISWGVAGAITSMLKPGDLLIANEVICEDTSLFPDDRWGRNIALDLNNTSISIYLEKLVSTDNMCSTPDDKMHLAANTGAYAVDMESAAIAKIAKEKEIDFLVLRAIADDVNTFIPTVVTQHTDILGRPKLLPFIISCLKQPGQIKELIKLAKYYNQALLTLKQIAPDLKKQHFLYNS